MALKKTAKKVVPAKKAAKSTAKPAKQANTAEKVVKATDSKSVVPASAKSVTTKKAATPEKAVTKPIAKKKEAAVQKTVVPATEKMSASGGNGVIVPVTPPVSKQKSVKSMHKEKSEAKQKGEPKPISLAKPVKKSPEPFKEVKIPKTNVKTSIAYKPQYTPLEKRVDIQKSNDSIVRYNDTDLNEFRDIINKKLETAKKELAYLQGLITRKDGLGGDESESRYVTMEDGGMSMEREQLSQMASRQIQYIDHLEKALMRIENKTYGICRVTGKLIDKARLRAVPHATLSLEAKLGLVKPAGEQ